MPGKNFAFPSQFRIYFFICLPQYYHYDDYYELFYSFFPFCLVIISYLWGGLCERPVLKDVQTIYLSTSSSVGQSKAIILA